MLDKSLKNFKLCKCIRNETNIFNTKTEPAIDNFPKILNLKTKYIDGCLDEISEKSKLFNNALDVACTLIKIMIICEIPECKAKKSVDSVIYFLLHFKCENHTSDSKPKRIMNKELLYSDLRNIAKMKKFEACFVCTVLGRVFKAFYYKQSINFFNEDYINKKKWREVVCEAIKAYSKYSTSSKDNIRCVAWKIHNTIHWYVEHKKKKCFPSDFISSCLAPCVLPILSEQNLNTCKKSSSTPQIPNEVLSITQHKLSETYYSQSEFKSDIKEDTEFKNELLNKSMEKRENHLENCLRKLSELEVLNSKLLEDIKIRDEQLDNLRKELENTKIELIEIADLKNDKTLEKLDFQLTLATKMNGEDLDLTLINIIPGQDLTHLRKLKIKDNSETYEYNCSKK